MSDHKESGGRRLRVRERRRYTEEFADEEDLLFGGRAFDVEHKLSANRFDASAYDFVHEMTGQQLTLSYFQRYGFEKPIVVKQLVGLGMKMPANTFSVWDVKACVGSRRVLDVMDVETQRDFNMTMKEWCNYFHNPERTRLLNVISLEFSHTKLECFVESPQIVKHLDWIDLVWPKHLKEAQTEGTNSIEDMKYPKVQKYCLMSVKGCYTDFHIDFGGTSVWYHILRGKKVFWLIPPTERNIQLYEQWVLSGKQSDIFFGDTVEQCARVHLEEGNTFFIPTGWIHAVFTPEDSLVFGGNFLHSFGIEKQLRVAQVEDVTKVPAKFRYPFYTEVLWYVLARYVYCLMGKNHLNCTDDGTPINKDIKTEKTLNGCLPTLLPTSKSNVHLTPFEISGLKAIIMWLSRLPPSKRSLPDIIVSAESLLNDAKLLIDEHNNDNHQMAITGRSVLYWSKKSSSNSPSNASSITAQLRQIKHTSFSLKQLRNKESPLSTPPRAESPPTRPLSSNQYFTNAMPNVNQDLIPSSFAGLIAQTGVNHQHQPSPPSASYTPIIASTSPIIATPSLALNSVSSQLQKPLITAMQTLVSPTPTTVSAPMSAFDTLLPPLYTMESNLNNTVTASSFSQTNSLNTYTSSLQPNLSADKKPKKHSISVNTDQLAQHLFSGDLSNNPASTHVSTYVNNNNSNFFNNIAAKTSPSAAPPIIYDAKVNVTTATTGSQSICSYPSALPPSGFHSTANEALNNKMVNSSTQSCSSIKLSPSGSGSVVGKANSNDSSRRRRTRCKKCDSCLRADCGECHFCKDMKKFGGPGRMKQSCIARQCLAPVLPHTACCMICGRDGWEKLVDPSISDETASSLMECSQCWEIVHPFCLNEKFPSLVLCDANINEDLPNSWECPRCVKSGSKLNTKLKYKSSSMINWSLMKKDESSPPEKRFRMEEEPPPSSDDESNANVTNSGTNLLENNEKDSNNQSDDENSDTSSNTCVDSNHTSSQSGSSQSSKSYSLLANNSSAHVRSCARFPLLSQGLKISQISANNSNSSSSGSNGKPQHSSSNGNKSEMKGLAALMVSKKKSESSRERLFKSLKGLKKTSELVNRLNMPPNKKLKQSPSVSSSQSVTNFSSNGSSFNQCSSQILDNSMISPSLEQNPVVLGNTNSNNNNNTNLKIRVNKSKHFKMNEESTDEGDGDNEFEDDDEEEEEDDDTIYTQINRNNEERQTGSPFIMNNGKQREIIQPKYVVRPAPLDEDISTSDDNDNESSNNNTDNDDCDNENNNSRSEEYFARNERNKIRKKHLKKFRRKPVDNLSHERDVVLPVLKFVSRDDLLRCMRVCKQWYGWCCDPSLWPRIDLTAKKITSVVLIGIVRRQPKKLSLSWTNISKRQLFWLISRLPQLNTLSLAGSSATAVSALSTCMCPPLQCLDVSFCDSLDDDLVKQLLSAPNDSRPGIVETKTRLRFVSEIRLAGTNISDVTIRLITHHLTFVLAIDLSQCHQITDMGIAVLGAASAVKLKSLNLSGCNNITDTSLDALRRQTNLISLDVRHCPHISVSACHKFVSLFANHKTNRLIMREEKLIEKFHVK